MSRKPAQRDDDTPLPPHGTPPAETRGVCSRCRMLTERSELAQYGARCLGCYRSWCNEPQPRQSVEGDKRVHPHDWARALKAREEAGERLSLAQRTMWREALGLPITGAIPTWEQTPEEYANGHPDRNAA